MANNSYNIRQITNYDITYRDSVFHNVQIPYRKENGEIDFRVENKEYKYAISEASIIKLGYCCEDAGIIYPIFLEVNGEYKEIQIGKDGMYEMQPEVWMDVNEEEPEEKTTNIIVTGVQLPTDVKFTFDYAENIN